MHATHATSDVAASANIYLPQMAEIVQIQQCTPLEKLFRIRFLDGHDLGHQPGQFVEISLFGIGECPISVTSSPTEKGYFELCVRKTGKVTDALHLVQTGTQVGIRGPFGRGFDPAEYYGYDLVFIGGGIGLVPMRSLINYVLHPTYRSKYNKISILYGAKNPTEFLFPDEMNQWSKRQDIDFRVTVDKPFPGWNGNVGVITTLIPSLNMDPQKTFCIIVGPPIMYKFVLISLMEKQIPDEKVVMSLERQMKCGVGKCGHCAIGHYYCCIDGPVFKYPEVKPIKEAL